MPCKMLDQNCPTGPKKDSKYRCYACHKLGHIKYKCPNNNKSGDLVQNEALFGEAFDADQWIADTGATHHITKSKNFVVTYESFSEPKPITLGNHKLMFAYGQGDINVETVVNNEQKKHHLKDVWYTPDVVKNLFSVPTAADKGMQYWLDKHSCKITKNGETLVVGNRMVVCTNLS